MTMDATTLNTVLLAALITIVGWLGKFAVEKFDKVLDHLTVLNSRTQKLESRMTAEEGKDHARPPR